MGFNWSTKINGKKKKKSPRCILIVLMYGFHSWGLNDCSWKQFSPIIVLRYCIKDLTFFIFFKNLPTVRRHSIREYFYSTVCPTISTGSHSVLFMLYENWTVFNQKDHGRSSTTDAEEGASWAGVQPWLLQRPWLTLLPHFKKCYGWGECHLNFFLTMKCVYCPSSEYRIKVTTIPLSILTTIPLRILHKNLTATLHIQFSIFDRFYIY